jgi:ribosomal protein L14
MRSANAQEVFECDLGATVLVAADGMPAVTRIYATVRQTLKDRSGSAGPPHRRTPAAF